MTVLRLASKHYDRLRVKVSAPRVAAVLAAGAVVASGTAAAKVAALAKDMAVAARFGSGAELDAFLLALALPMFVVNVAAGTLPAALTPAYIAARTSADRESSRDLAGRALLSTYGLLALLSVVVLLVTLLMPTPQGLSRSMLAMFGCAMVPYTLLQGASSAWAGLLAAEGRFATGATAPIAQPAVMGLAVLLTTDRLGAWALVLGLLAGTAVQAMLLARAMRAAGLPLGARGGMPGVVRSEYAPAAAGALVMSLNPVVDQFMAASLPLGAVSSLSYGGKVTAMLMGMGAATIGATLLPLFSEHASEHRRLRRTLQRAERAVALVSIPGTLALVALSPWLVTMLFLRGEFDVGAAKQVTVIQQLLLLQLPVHLLGLVYVRALSAARANRVLLRTSGIGAVVNIVANALLMSRWGVLGIATSTVLVYLCTCVFLRHHVFRVIGNAPNGHPDGTIRTGVAAGVKPEAPCASAP